uniref:Uncharacterized protein n=1 Tax=Neisseria meningitidis alpha153 TaxID=663926 RepID=C6SAK0_NEIME|nr:hypothetical protein NME_0311 [Neisseria meningitidis alpha153]
MPVLKNTTSKPNAQTAATQSTARCRGCPTSAKTTSGANTAQIGGGYVMFITGGQWEGVSLQNCPEFCALEGTRTFSLNFKDVFIPDEDIIAAPEQFADYIQSIKAGFILLQIGIGAGVIDGSLGIIRLANIVNAEVNRYLDDGYDSLKARLDGAWAETERLAGLAWNNTPDTLATLKLREAAAVLALARRPIRRPAFRRKRLPDAQSRPKARPRSNVCRHRNPRDQTPPKRNSGNRSRKINRRKKPKPPPRHSRESGNPAPNATGIHRKKQKPPNRHSRKSGNPAPNATGIHRKKQKPSNRHSRKSGNPAPPNATGIHRKNRNLQTVIPTEVGIQ